VNVLGQEVLEPVKRFDREAGWMKGKKS
jgi:hypothetical protein